MRIRILGRTPTEPKRMRIYSRVSAGLFALSLAVVFGQNPSSRAQAEKSSMRHCGSGIGRAVLRAGRRAGGAQGDQRSGVPESFLVPPTSDAVIVGQGGGSRTSLIRKPGSIPLPRSRRPGTPVVLISADAFTRRRCWGVRAGQPFDVMNSDTNPQRPWRALRQ